MVGFHGRISTSSSAIGAAPGRGGAPERDSRESESTSEAEAVEASQSCGRRNSYSERLKRVATAERRVELGHGLDAQGRRLGTWGYSLGA